MTGEKSDIFLEYIRDVMPAGVQVEIELVNVIVFITLELF